MRYTSRGYKRGTEGAWDIIWLKLLPLAGGEVLDVGCGEHIWSVGGWEVTRCDNVQIYPGNDRRGDLGEFDHVDLNYVWPYNDKQFTGVVAADVIEHVENIQHFMREAVRVSREFVIISTPNVESRLSREMFAKVGDLWGFTPKMVWDSHHLSPVFRWQIELGASKSGWVVDRYETTNDPLQDLPDEPSLQELQSSLPRTDRTLVARMVPR